MTPPYISGSNPFPLREDRLSGGLVAALPAAEAGEEGGEAAPPADPRSDRRARELLTMRGPALDRSILARSRSRAETVLADLRTPEVDPRIEFDESLQAYLGARTTDPELSRTLLNRLQTLSRGIRSDLHSDAPEHQYEDLARLRAYYRARIADRDSDRPPYYWPDTEGFQTYELQSSILRNQLGELERDICRIRNEQRDGGTLDGFRLAARINFEMGYASGLAPVLTAWEARLAATSSTEISDEERANQYAQIMRGWASIRDRRTGSSTHEDMRAPVTISEDEIVERMRHAAQGFDEALSGLEISSQALDDFRARLHGAIDSNDSAWFSNLTGNSIREFLGFSEMGHFLLAAAEAAPEADAESTLRRMQAAQIFAELGLRNRVREALGPISVADDPELCFQIAALYQSAGMEDEATATLRRLMTGDPEADTLARVMIHLNAGEVEEAEALLVLLPDSERARQITESLESGERHRRALQTIEVMRTVSLDFIQQGRDSDYDVVNLDQVERETLAAWNEVTRLVLSGEAESVRVAIRQVQESGVYPNFTLGAWGLDERRIFDGSCSPQANYLHEFLDRVDRAGVSDAEFHQAMFGLGASLEAYDGYAAAHEIYLRLAEIPECRTEARGRIDNLPTRQRINAALSSFAIFTSGSDPITSVQNFAMLLGPFAVARGAAAVVDAAWVARGATLIRNPLLFRAVGFGLRTGTEAAAFTLSSMAMHTLFTGDIDIWSAEHFGREWAAMVVTFTLLHGAGAGITRLGYRSGIVPWAGRVGSFTASEYVNEAVGLADEQATPFTARLFLSAVTDAQMMLAGRMINGASGGRLERMELRTREGYAEHGRAYLRWRAMRPPTPSVADRLRSFGEGARAGLGRINMQMLSMILGAPGGGGGGEGPRLVSSRTESGAELRARAETGDAEALRALVNEAGRSEAGLGIFRDWLGSASPDLIRRLSLSLLIQAAEADASARPPRAATDRVISLEATRQDQARRDQERRDATVALIYLAGMGHEGAREWLRGRDLGALNEWGRREEEQMRARAGIVLRRLADHADDVEPSPPGTYPPLPSRLSIGEALAQWARSGAGRALELLEQLAAHSSEGVLGLTRLYEMSRNRDLRGPDVLERAERNDAMRERVVRALVRTAEARPEVILDLLPFYYEHHLANEAIRNLDIRAAVEAMRDPERRGTVFRALGELARYNDAARRALHGYDVGELARQALQDPRARGDLLTLQYFQHAGATQAIRNMDVTEFARRAEREPEFISTLRVLAESGNSRARAQLLGLNLSHYQDLAAGSIEGINHLRALAEAGHPGAERALQELSVAHWAREASRGSDRAMGALCHLARAGNTDARRALIRAAHRVPEARVWLDRLGSRQPLPRLGTFIAGLLAFGGTWLAADPAFASFGMGPHEGNGGLLAGLLTLLTVAVGMAHDGGGSSRSTTVVPATSTRYDPNRPGIREFELSLLDAEIAEVSTPPDPRSPDRFVYRIAVDGVQRIDSLRDILGRHRLPSEVGGLQVVLPTVGAETRPALEGLMAEARRLGLSLEVRNEAGESILELHEGDLSVHLRRFPSESLGDLLPLVPEGRLRVFLDGVERFTFSRTAGGPTHLEFNLRRSSTPEAQELLALVEELPPQLLEGAQLRVQGLPGTAYSSPGVRSALARLTGRALRAGMSELTVLIDSEARGSRVRSETLFSITRAPASSRLTYSLHTDRTLREIQAIAAQYFTAETLAMTRRSPNWEGNPLSWESLAQMWEAAFAHADGFSANGSERNIYQGYFSAEQSVSRWIRSLEVLAGVTRQGPAAARDVHSLLNSLLLFSEPTPGEGLLGHRAFHRRALGDNAFELIRILEGGPAVLQRCLNQLRMLGTDRNVTVGGALLGLIYKAEVAGDGAARRELDSLRDQVRWARGLDSRVRFTILPEDSRCRTRTPEWVVEVLNEAGGVEYLMGTEVKARNAIRMSGEEAGMMIRTAVDQLTTHPFTRGVSDPRSLLVIRFSDAGNPRALRELVTRLLREELTRRSGDASLRDSARRMRGLSVMVYYSNGSRSAPHMELFTFRGEAGRGGNWEAWTGERGDDAGVLREALRMGAR